MKNINKSLEQSPKECVSISVNDRNNDPLINTMVNKTTNNKCSNIFVSLIDNSLGITSLLSDPNLIKEHIDNKVSHKILKK